MAAYEVTEPTIAKLKELACITFNLRFYENRFGEYKDPKDEMEAVKWRIHLDNWHTDYIKKIP